MRYRLPSLSALKAFEATARCGGVSAAARELNVSAGSISRHVALLEEHFGCQLVQRHRGGTDLTDIGLQFFRGVSEAFDRLDVACGYVSGSRDPSTLIIRLYPSIAAEWIAAGLRRFRALYPSITTRLITSTSDVDFQVDNVDIAIGVSPKTPADVSGTILFLPCYTPVCAPSLIHGGTLVDFEHEALLYSPREKTVWKHWGQESGQVITFESGLLFDNACLTYQAARVGAGIAIGDLSLLASDVLAGRLVTPSPIILDAEHCYYMLCRKHREQEPAIAAFKQWLLDECVSIKEAVQHVRRRLP